MPTSKRSNYMQWPDYFMATAFLSAQRSKDPHTQVGAVIVNADNRIVGIGYNGLPRGCSDDIFPWHKNDNTDKAGLEQKYMYVCHAEVNAVLNKNSTDVTDCTIYVALFPCNECAKVIIQSGIRRIVYMSDKHAEKPSTRASRRMFEASGTECVQFVPSPNGGRIAIDYGQISTTSTTNEATVRMLNALTLNEHERSPVPNKMMSSPKNCNDSTTGKRADYLSWSDYFMAVAVLSAQRSKDPNTQVGACIVNQLQQIVGIGYNGFPHGCSDDEFPWTRPVESVAADPLDNKHLYVCHAEVNAILNKNAANVANCTIYVTLFPCNECAKIVIQSGIRHIVYLSDKYAQSTESLAAKRMFAAAGVNYEQFMTSRRKVVIDFSDIEKRNLSQLPTTPPQAAK